MVDRKPETDTKLNMSLDALIGQSNRDQRKERVPVGRNDSAGDGGRGRGRSGPQGRGPSGRGQFPRNGERSFGRGPAMTNTGLVMPSFGPHPYGGFPPGPFMDNMGFAPVPFGFMPHDRMLGMPAEPPMPPNMPAGSFFRGNMRMPESSPADAAVPPVPAGPAAVPQARLEEESGQVMVTFKGNEIVKITRNGAVTLDSGGVRGPAVFMALNAVLNVVGISITRPKKDDDWSIADGRSMMRFRDGVTLPAKGPQSAQRGSKILAAFGGSDPNAAAAATAASNAAAAAAGIILPGRPGSGKGTPGRGQRGPGGRPQQNQNGNAPGNAEQGGAGGKASEEENDRIRRLKAKGRYQPY